MPAIESLLTDEQKKTLDEARRILGFRSRNMLFAWFADNAADIARGQLSGIGFVDQEINSLLELRGQSQ